MQLIRRTSKHVGCFPVSGSAVDNRQGSFGCISNDTMFVRNGCAGLFRCGTGAVMCGHSSEKGEVKCSCSLALKSVAKLGLSSCLERLVRNATMDAIVRRTYAQDIACFGSEDK